MSEDLDRGISIPVAAEKLGIHVKTAQRLAKAGKFPVPVVKVGNKQVVSLRRVLELLEGQVAS